MAGTTPALRRDLKVDEGIRSRAYKDTKGKLTIGVGHNIEADGVMSADEARWVRDGMKIDEIDALLEQDIAVVEADLDRALPWWRTLNDVRRDVLANMCFNLGITKLLKFRATLALTEADLYEAASAQMLKSLWAAQVGARANRLSNLMKAGVRV